MCRHSVWDDITDLSLRRAQRGSNLLLLRGRLLRHSVPRSDRQHVISRRHSDDGVVRIPTKRSPVPTVGAARIETSERPFRSDPLGFDTPAATQPALVWPSWRRGHTARFLGSVLCDEAATGIMSSVGAGRRLRCLACGHWSQASVSGVPAAPPANPETLLRPGWPAAWL